jgi:hypothetical protein
VNVAASADLEARRARLAREYAEAESDLGGLVYEMAIRDSYRLEVITRRAAKLQAIDAQLTEVEQAITALAQPSQPAPPVPVPPPSPAAPAPAASAPAAAPPAPAPVSASQAPTAVVPPVGPVSPAANTQAICPSCAHPIEPGAAFCGTCGAALGSAPPPAGATAP